jgi:methyl-accepting chemotaxis protein
MRLAPRLLLAFGTVILAFSAVVGLGITGIMSIRSSSNNVFQTDVAVSVLAYRANAGVLNLRRYEKDLILNRDDVKTREGYFANWSDVLTDTAGLLNEAKRAESVDEERTKIDAMLVKLDEYAKNFRLVYAKITKGAFKRAEDANAAMTPYKPIIRELESEASALGMLGPFHG